jgi:hypothetical protein
MFFLNADFLLTGALYSYFSKVTTFCSIKNNIIPHASGNAISPIVLKFYALSFNIWLTERKTVATVNQKVVTFEK